MKRVYKLIGLSALFLRRDAFASSEFNKLPPSITLPFDPEGDVEITDQVLQETTLPPSTPITSLEDSRNPAKPKKRAKKETAEKKKPTISKTTRSPPSASPPKSSATLRRIKKEYYDAVSMGICYDWAKQKLVKPKEAATTNQEYQKLICLGPLVSNLRHWHFSFRGCGIYEKGIYHGRIILPKDYPATPPRVQLWTPSGRFVPQHDICLSASSYHPESWTPRWTVLSLVQALRLHMLTNPQEIGGKLSSREETEEYARESLTWWARFGAGKKMIEINHALLLRQEVLSLTESEEKKSSDEEEKKGANEPKHDSLVEEAKNATKVVPEVVDAESPKESGSETVTPKPSESSKPKKKRKPKKQGGGGRGSAIVQQSARKKEIVSELPGVLPVVLMKVIGSPFRIGLFSLVLLFWVTSFIPS